MILNPKTRYEMNMTLLELDPKEYRKINEGDMVTWRMKGCQFSPGKDYVIVNKLDNNTVQVEYKR